MKRNNDRKVIVGGDLDAKSSWWESPVLNNRKRWMVEEWVGERDIIVPNEED